MTFVYDALVIGAGYIGVSVAYHFSKAGLRTALLDRGGVGSGASRANYGNIQVQDAELAHSLDLIQAGYASFEGLEAELGQPVGLRQLGSLLLIENEAQWQMMAARLPRLHTAGIRAELVEASHLPDLEPLLDVSALLGACYHQREGQIYPFALLSAFLNAGQKRGLSLHWRTEVNAIITRADRVTGVRTSRGDFSAGVVALCTGAWTTKLGRMVERNWPVRHVIGQALITEAAPTLRLRNHLASAAFFQEAHGGGQDGGTERAILAFSQTREGHFLLGEAARVTCDMDIRATPTGQPAIARLAARFLPALQKLQVLRGWAAAVAFTYDGLPLLGPVAGLKGLILATAFKSTVIVTPLVGRLVTELALTGCTQLDITPFSPDR